MGRFGDIWRRDSGSVSSGDCMFILTELLALPLGWRLVVQIHLQTLMLHILASGFHDYISIMINARG